MGHINHLNYNIGFDPVPAKDTKISVQHSGDRLIHFGLNLLVEVSVGAAFTQNLNGVEPAKTLMLAHVDTGTGRTSIDIGIAEKMGLISIGRSYLSTASGTLLMDDFVIDLKFVNSSLKNIENIKVSSCKLPYKDSVKDNNSVGRASVAEPHRMGLLIGRDILSNWHMTWHGPSSSVFISD